jgi:hypothetical protein
MEAGARLAAGKEVRCVGVCANWPRVFAKHPKWVTYATAVRSNCMIMILTTYPTMPYMHIAGRRHLSQLLQPRSPLDSISDGVQHARQSSDSVAWSYCELMRSVCCRWRDVHDRHLHVSPLLDHWVDGRRGIRRASYRIGGHHFTTKMLPACRICGSIRV